MKQTIILFKDDTKHAYHIMSHHNVFSFISPHFISLLSFDLSSLPFSFSPFICLNPPQNITGWAAGVATPLILIMPLDIYFSKTKTQIIVKFKIGGKLKTSPFSVLHKLVHFCITYDRIDIWYPPIIPSYTPWALTQLTNHNPQRQHQSYRIRTQWLGISV